MVDNTHNEDRGELIEPKKRSAGIVNGIALTIFVLIGVAAIYWVLNINKDKEPEPERKRLLTESVPDYTMPPPEPKPIPKPTPIPKPIPKPVKKVTLKPLKAPAKPEKKKDPLLERLLSPELGSDKVAGKSSIKSSPNLKQSVNGGEYQNIGLSVTKTPLVQASRLPNQNWLIPKGVPIPCALNVAIQSDQPGLLTCTTTEDIYSSDGTVILIDRGSNVTGEYRTSSLSIGKSRIFAIWDRIRTPDGVVVNLNSPATDTLGRAGIGGYIDNHYLERFGVAILVSLIDDVFEEGTDNARFDNTEDEFRNVSGEFLRQYQRVRPTLHRPQGGELNIIVARDLDLSTVYELRYVK